MVVFNFSDLGEEFDQICCERELSDPPKIKRKVSLIPGTQLRNSVRLLTASRTFIFSSSNENAMSNEIFGRIKSINTGG